MTEAYRVTEFPQLREGRARRETGFCQATEDLRIPFAIIEGDEPGPLLVTTAGVHGSELCSIQAALRLAQLEPEALRGTLVILPILNFGGFRARSIYVLPEDRKNLNRQFPGKADGTASERLAHWVVTNAISHADALIDLHGGDLNEALKPFTFFTEGDAASQKLAEVFGTPIAASSGSGTYLSSGLTLDAATSRGIPAIISEIGANGIWSDELVDMHYQGVLRVMTHLGMLKVGVPMPTTNPTFIRFWVPCSSCDGLWFPTKKVGDAVKAGDVLGEVREIFGRPILTIASEHDGEILYQLTSLWVNEGEQLVGLAYGAHSRG